MAAKEKISNVSKVDTYCSWTLQRELNFVFICELFTTETFERVLERKVTKLQTIVVVVCRQNCTAVNFPQDLIVGLRKPFMVVISLWQQPICNHCRKVLSFDIWSKLKLHTRTKKIAINFNNFGQKERLSIRGQREVFFRSRDKNENFSYSISHIVTRWEFLALNLRHRDEIEIHYLQSRTSRREGELRIRQFSQDLLFATCNLTDIFQRKRRSNFFHWEI